jgi:lipopolysaccharide transport system ATP-binding protein
VLRDVTFSVERGEAMAVIGANGAGKSTLLKLITGTTQKTSGDIQVTGRVAAMLELGMGFHSDFTGRQNAMMAGQLLGYTAQEMAESMPAIEAFADIGYYFDEPIRIYSSGMQVRLGFAVATARRPELLIIDEALSVGDAHFQHKSFGRIREFQRDGTTLLLVSHDLGAVRSLCSRTVWLDKGLMRGFGDTRTVVDEYSAFVYSQRQEIRNVVGSPGSESSVPEEKSPPIPWETPGALPDVRDCRQDFVNQSSLRNEIRVFPFDKGAAKWGNGDVRIASASLQGATDEPLRWVMGGERARVRVDTVASVDKPSVLVGFIVKDRTGQALFGDNTYLSHLERPVFVRAGATYRTEFDFRMPVLPRGTYALAVAAASGTQDEHVVEEWIDEALYFESHNANTVQGLVGIPMQAIRVTAVGEQAPESAKVSMGAAEWFRLPHYCRNNQRRQEHLATLGLPIAGKSVLEVGAGIGDHTGFLLDRGCRVLATDGREDLLAVLRSQHPTVPTLAWDVESTPPAGLDSQDVVYAYGLLYHTGNPQAVLDRLAGLCHGFLILETCVSYGDDPRVNPVAEAKEDPTQSIRGVGCRPTRSWVLGALKRLFPHAYVTRTQPWHDEFSLDWSHPEPSSEGALARAVFVASRDPLDLPTLSSELLPTQTRC